MIHGPCGSIYPLSPCMKDGNCTKMYPRDFLKETQTGHDGYPLYRRWKPEDGGQVTIKKVRGSEVVIENRWIVPFCPLLSRAFNAHINVEYCSSIESIKYVCKYINKGSDMAIFNLTNNDIQYDEIQTHEIERYLSSNEAVWRILGFSIHERHPNVVHLSVHLDNGQRVYFTEENVLERVQDPPETTLTAFFSLCQSDAFALSLLYHQVPKYYTWNKSNKKWVPRKSGQTVPDHPGIKSSDALGHVYTVHPSNSECFHLRLLLHEVIGPTSFSDLKTLNGIVCETFIQACGLRGLLEEDSHWKSTLDEAATTHSGRMLRDLFAVILHTCCVSNLVQLWNLHRENMSEDILHKTRIAVNNMDLDYNDEIFNSALLALEDKIKTLGGTDLKVFGLPEIHRDINNSLNYEIIRETRYNIHQLTSYIETNEPNLIDDQRLAFEKITSAVFTETGGIYFLDAPGGTGKTYLINLLLAKVRQRNLIALAVASSSIAATLLTGGRTAHSVSKLPINLSFVENPVCNISRSSDRAKLLKKCKLIVWDECTMAHKLALEVLNTTMQDIFQNNKCMGGVTLVLSGDFRQTLPVIPRGTKADEMNASIKASYIWKMFKDLD
ncbi:uncharacterized protein LOC129971825 [Argiope bruennichi]|uniref:uncharacterized protein LOC129971825 n=1 Tax=Argiope bruennichi TaxID=94029 RepID=UPI0024954359|nr:uncharacterized protein LOC129971825 [Argiope bruennichi]